MKHLSSHPLTPLKNGVQKSRSFTGRGRDFWVPTFVGMMGVWVVGCHNNRSVNSANDNQIERVDYVEGWEDLGLTYDMDQRHALMLLKENGWQLKESGIHINNTTLLWSKNPCRAASINGSKRLERQSMTRPPKILELHIEFFICENEKPINVGRLSSVKLSEKL